MFAVKNKTLTNFVKLYLLSRFKYFTEIVKQM